MGYGWSEKEGLEADDLIATKVKELEQGDSEMTIVSSDKDLAQLVSTNVKQLLPPPRQTQGLAGVCWMKVG